MARVTRIATLLVGFPLATMTLLFCAPPAAPAAPRDERGHWSSYDHRYAIVVMGGSVTGQMYRWYWNDTSGEVWTLMDWGFAPDDIIYLSYGDSANVHPELVDGTSTYANVEAAFAAIADVVTPADLVHVWWVDHGSPSGFEVHGGFVSFTVLRAWIDALNCRAYLGAYNPCYSGAIMPYMAGLCTETRRVITATSVTASQGNSYGWAGKWRQALRGGCPDDYVPNYTDTNHDGYIGWDEAYEWETPHSNAAGEYPLFDDNCDGVGGDFRYPATYDSSGANPALDGYFGQFYSLMAWSDPAAGGGWHERGILAADPAGAAGRPLAGGREPDGRDRELRGSQRDQDRCGGDPKGRDRPREDIVIVWREASPLPAPVARGASGMIDGQIYLFGGHPAPAPVHYRYDPREDHWYTDLAALPVPGSLVRGVMHNGGLYVFGGHTLGSDDIRRYDPGTDSWEMLSSPFPSGVRECCKYGAGVVGDRIYFGYVEERYSYEPILSAWEYDIAGDAWTAIPLPPSPERMYVASASDGADCYLLGGIAHDAQLSVLADAIRFDPISGQWEAIEPLPEPVAFSDGDFLGDYLVIAGGGAGYDPWPASDRVYCWSEAHGWLTATPLPAPVGSPHVELANIDGRDHVFVFGGYNGGYLSTLYVGEILWDPSGIDDDPSLSLCLELSVSSPALAGRPVLIDCALPADCHVRLTVHDLLGRRVATLADGLQARGRQCFAWDAGAIARGVYFCRLEAGGRSAAQRVLWLR